MQHKQFFFLCAAFNLFLCVFCNYPDLPPDLVGISEQHSPSVHLIPTRDDHLDPSDAEAHNDDYEKQRCGSEMTPSTYKMTDALPGSIPHRCSFSPYFLNSDNYSETKFREHGFFNESCLPLDNDDFPDDTDNQENNDDDFILIFFENYDNDHTYLLLNSSTLFLESNFTGPLARDPSLVSVTSPLVPHLISNPKSLSLRFPIPLRRALYYLGALCLTKSPEGIYALETLLTEISLCNHPIRGYLLRVIVYLFPSPESSSSTLPNFQYFCDLISAVINFLVYLLLGFLISRYCHLVNPLSVRTTSSLVIIAINALLKLISEAQDSTIINSILDDTQRVFFLWCVGRLLIPILSIFFPLLSHKDRFCVFSFSTELLISFMSFSRERSTKNLIVNIFISLATNCPIRCHLALLVRFLATVKALFVHLYRSLSSSVSTHFNYFLDALLRIILECFDFIFPLIVRFFSEALAVILHSFFMFFIQ